MGKRIVGLVGLILFVATSLLAQPPDKKKPKDFFQIKAPSIEYSSPDTTNILFEEEFIDTSEAFRSIYFKPEKEHSILEEDTADMEGGDLQIVEVSEQMKMDCVWVTIAEYYAIWDSRVINPYQIDATKFDDTLALNLYDSLAGLGFSMPLTVCRPTSHFGFRKIRWHYGTDLGLVIGDPVLAAFDGIVRIQQYDAQGYGNYVLIRHYNGLETLYGHMSKVNVKVGQYVKAGDVIGLGGNTGRSTGPHLHFEVRYEGNAIDPETVFSFSEGALKDKTFQLMPEHFEYLKEARKVFYHTVRSGDNLGVISRKYGVPVATICRLNGITTKTPLRVGRKIRIR